MLQELQKSVTEQETAVQDLRATLASDAACIQSQQRSLQDTLQTVNTLRARVAELEKALCERESELQKLSKQLVESNAALAVFQSSPGVNGCGGSVLLSE